MKWEVMVVPKGSNSSQHAMNVDAANWMEALKFSMDHMVGVKKEGMKIVSCQIKEDHTICIADLTTKSVFQIKPLEAGSALPPIPEPEGESFLESKRSEPASEAKEQVQSFMSQAVIELPPSPPPVISHEVFFKRDEKTEVKGAGVAYRERIIMVSPETPYDQVANLIMYYFESLRREIMPLPGGKYINLAIYDHKFKGNPKGPALAVLSWQDWKHAEPVVVFPKKEAIEDAAAQRSAMSKEATPEAPPTAAVETPPQVAARVPQPPQERTPSPPPTARHRPTPVPEELEADRVLSEVFEELQEMFLAQTQEEAADLVLKIATKKIPVEAGTVFLADINTRDLMFAAVVGPKAEELRGKKLIMTKGIVGFAAREGATIAVADVSKDPRFCSDFDQSGSFITKSVLCAPVQYEGRTYGAIELVNRRGGDVFTRSEINVVTYLASQLAQFIATSLPSGEPDFLEEEKGTKPKAAKKSSLKKPRSRK